MNEKFERIQLIDAVRGFSIILMIAYHFGYDLVQFGLLPAGVLYNPLLNVLEPFFAGVFIMLSGVSSRFSKSNIKRSLKTAAAALAVTAVTFIIGQPVKFGILHFLAFSMLFFGFLKEQIDKIPEKAAPFIYLVLFTVFKIALNRRFDVPYLWWLGFPDINFSSADYFPVLPWIFVFLFGTLLGKWVIERRLPSRFYTFDVPVLPPIGRKSLLIYLLHQPVLYGIAYALFVIFIK